jgi:alanine racemase
VRHLANSAGAIGVPASRYDLVRVGIAMYGLSPGAAIGSASELGLRPVMSLRARLASVKRIAAGAGVSYGHSYVTDRETSVGLVPLGYGDGIPRAASNAGPVLAAGAVRPVAGRVCMDQLVVDLGDDIAEPGDEVLLFGEGGPSADDWAAVCGTIGYEIVTRIGPRVPRVTLGVTS